MFCERTLRTRGWLAGLLAATVLLLVAAPGVAAEPALAADQLADAGTLARGAGFASHSGSQPVRELQRSLRRLGNNPGPVDGLFGPLTEGAVERFQQAHGLATDGVVGTQTKRRLLAQGAKRPVADTSRPTHTGQLARKSPSGGTPAESAIEQPARIAPSATPSRAGPPTSDGTPPELLALLAVLAAGALLIALRAYGRRAREATVNFGMVCAALLATFVIGAAAGALFATQAAPDAGGETFADSGALLAARGAPSHRLDRETREAQARGVRPARKARRSPAPVDHRRAAPLTPASREPETVAQRAPAAPARPSTSTYTVRRGDALWPIAKRHLARSSSVREIAKQVQALESLNVNRLASGDPDVIEAGEELRLP